MKKEMITLGIISVAFAYIFLFGSCEKQEIEKEPNKGGEIDTVGYMQDTCINCGNTFVVDTTVIDTIKKDSIIIEIPKIDKIILKDTDKKYITILSPQFNMENVDNNINLFYILQKNSIYINYNIEKDELDITLKIEQETTRYCIISFIFDDGTKFNYKFDTNSISKSYPHTIINQENINKFKTNKLVKCGYNVMELSWVNYFDIETKSQTVVMQYLLEIS